MIKLVAVDMDGTFLNSNMDYDRKRFLAIYRMLKEKGVHFVVASGNQYYQLKSFFPGLDEEISYVAENGAMVIEHNKIIAIETFDTKDVTEILDTIEAYQLKHSVLCTATMAYVIQNDEYVDLHKKYYHKLHEIISFREVSDPVIKLNLNFDEGETDFYVNLFNEKFKGRIKAVSSGHGNLDLITQATSKAEGLKRLCHYDHIDPSEVMVFGDGGNDIAMLEWAHESYAMENAPDKIKAIAKYICPSNDEQGVLSILEKTFI